MIKLWIITKSYHVIITLVAILYDNYPNITSDGPSLVHNVKAIPWHTMWWVKNTLKRFKKFDYSQVLI
jgi:hypothetical protein